MAKKVPVRELPDVRESGRPPKRTVRKGGPKALSVDDAPAKVVAPRSTRPVTAAMLMLSIVAVSAASGVYYVVATDKVVESNMILYEDAWLNLTVTDGSTRAPLQGAAVEVKGPQGRSDTVAGMTDASGKPVIESRLFTLPATDAVYLVNGSMTDQLRDALDAQDAKMNGDMQVTWRAGSYYISVNGNEYYRFSLEGAGNSSSLVVYGSELAEMRSGKYVITVSKAGYTGIQHTTILFGKPIADQKKTDDLNNTERLSVSAGAGVVSSSSKDKVQYQKDLGSSITNCAVIILLFDVFIALGAVMCIKRMRYSIARIGAVVAIFQSVNFIPSLMFVIILMMAIVALYYLWKCKDEFAN